MPVQSKVDMKYGPTSWGTYGSQGVVTYNVVKQVDRTRSWSNSAYRTPLSRAKRIMSSGFLPTQSYTDNLQHVVNSKVVTITGQKNSNPASTFTWRFIPVVNRIACSVLDADAASARLEALGKIQGTLSGVGTSVPLTILEAGKTANMIGDAAGRILRSYRHVRHGNFLAAAKSLGLDKTPRRVGRHRSPEENWLEYRYGWRLVVYDIESYMKQIHDMLTTKPIVHRVTSFVARSGSPNRYAVANQSLRTPPGDGYFRYTLNGVETRDVQATAGYIYALESTALATGQQLGLLNLPAVAWDIIPASFMVDWAVNVSSVLEGLTAFQGKKFLDGWTCVSVQTGRTQWWTNLRPYSGIFSLNAGTEFYTGPVIERRFSRAVLSGFSPASLRLDFSASFKNGLDGLALIKQVFGSKR